MVAVGLWYGQAYVMDNENSDLRPYVSKIIIFSVYLA